MALCRLLHEENGIYSMSETKVRDQITSMLSRDNGLIGLIGERGNLEGCIAMVIDCMWYSEVDYHLLELFNFVHPNYRTPPGRAKALIEFAKHCSDELHIPLQIGIISNSRTEAKVRLYQRQLPQVGAFFLYGAVTGRAGTEDGQ